MSKPGGAGSGSAVPEPEARSEAQPSEVVRIGLSTNLSATAQPHPYRLLDAHPGAFDFVEYSAPLDIAEARRDAALFAELERRLDEVPVLFHPVHLNLYGPALETPAALAALAAHARAVRSPWVSNDVAWWHSAGRLFPGALYIPPPLSEAGLDAAVAHALHVQAALGELPLVLENPVVFARRGPMHVLDFMAELHRRTGCALLLDLGHLYGHQLAQGLAIDDGLDRFPLEAVIEIHIAGGVVIRDGERRFWADDHPQPIPEALFGLLDRVLPRATSLRAITYEGDGHPQAMAVANLRRIRDRTREIAIRRVPDTHSEREISDRNRAGVAISRVPVAFSRVPPGVSPVPAPVSAVPAGVSAVLARDSEVPASVLAVPSRDSEVPPSVLAHPRRDREAPDATREARALDPNARGDAWALFDRLYGAAPAGPHDDEAADAADRAYRLTVLAEILDRALPLTRALLCPTPGALHAFSASPEHRAAYEPPGRAPADALLRYARRVAREQGDTTLATVAAVEGWAYEITRAPKPARPTELPVRLAPFTVVADLPADLSLALHARTTLDRHQLGRARALGAYAFDADALREVAARAPRGPWPAAARRKGSRVELIALTEADRELLGRVEQGGPLDEPDRDRLESLLDRGLLELTPSND